jgi:cytochrome subunit of sulfide dehydrogenase
MRFQFVPAALLATCSLSAIAQGADSTLARNLAATCANCHNTTGRSVTGTPAIAGQSRELLAKALRDFKEGKRTATIMHQLAKGYTDEQLELIAAYFAAQK